MSKKEVKEEMNLLTTNSRCREDDQAFYKTTRGVVTSRGIVMSYLKNDITIEDEFIMFAGEKVYLKDIRYIRVYYWSNTIKIKRKSKFWRLKEKHSYCAVVDRHFDLLERLHSYWSRLERGND